LSTEALIDAGILRCSKMRMAMGDKLQCRGDDIMPRHFALTAAKARASVGRAHAPTTALAAQPLIQSFLN
jgi:hypothetical protein